MENSDWQTNLCTVRERTKYAHHKALFCDVNLSVYDWSTGAEEVITIPTTKYMLAVTSPVFAAMLYGQLAETQPTIELPDCTKEGVQEFLRYVHSDQVCLSGSNVVEVLYIAEKYIVPHLIKKCKEFIENELKPEDVFCVLPKISLIWDRKLEQRCWEIVSKETQRAVSSQPFLDISHSLLREVLLRDKLQIKEISLFHAVDRWVSKRIQELSLDVNGSVKRGILGDNVIRSIRFPLMTEKEFAQFVLPRRVLKMHEVTELIQIFNSIPQISQTFCGKKRDGKSHFLSNHLSFSKHLLLVPSNRFKTVQPFAFNGLLMSSIDFQVNKAVYLVGARLFGSEGSCYEVDFSIHEIEEKSGKYVSKCHFISTFETDAGKIDELYHALDVILNEPVKVFPGNQYRVRFQMKGLHECIGCNGKSEAICQDIKITYKNPTIGPNERFTVGVNEGGQIQTLIFKRR